MMPLRLARFRVLLITFAMASILVANQVPSATAASGVVAPETSSDAVSNEATAEYLDTLASSVPSEDVEVGAVDVYMSDHGVDASTATRNLAIQAAFGVLEARISRISGDALSSTWTHHGEVPVLEVRLKEGTDDVKLVKALSELSPLVVVSSGSDESAARNLEAVASALVGLEGVVGIGVDGSTGNIQVDVSAERPGSVAAEDIVMSRVAQVGVDLESVLVEVSEGPVGDTRRGGLHMSSCTTGFGVQNSSGTRGIITAGHCGNSQSYQLHGSSTWYSMTYQNELRSANADLQWHTTAAAEEGRFHANSTSSSRALTSVVPRANQGGDYVCSRGKTSGYRCGDVTSISYQPTWSGACPNTTCNAVFVRVSAGTSGGDSGGPWFNASAGYGIQKGGSSSYSVHTSTNYFGSLGVAVFYG